MKLKNLFTSGKMNKDLDERLVPKGEYRDALNVRVANSTGSNVGAVENSLSNVLKSALDFGSGAKCIGAVDDDEANRVYWFVKSEAGSYIAEFDSVSSQSSIVLEDTRSNSILNFQTSHMIQANVLTDADNEKKFLYFTDGINPPRRINIKTAKSYEQNGFQEEDISVIVKPPLHAPDIELKKDNDPANRIEESFIRFAYRYKYLDGEYSTLSPLSELAFQAKSFNYSYLSGVNFGMENFYNNVDVYFDTGSSLVTDIEVVFKEDGNNNVYIIDSLNKKNKKYSDNTLASINFRNDKIYKVLPERQLFRLYDNVPLRAYAQDFIDNRIAYGNYVENYDLVTCDQEKVDVDLDLSIKIPERTNSGFSMKSDRDYEVGISYLDEYGRSSTILTSDNGVVHNPIYNSIFTSSLSLKINHIAPLFSKYYRIFLKQSRDDYQTVVSPTFYNDLDYVYLLINRDDKNKLLDKEFVYIKSDTSGVKSSKKKTKILSITDEEANFLQRGSTPPTSTINLAGTYVKIEKEPGLIFHNDNFFSYSDPLNNALTSDVTSTGYASANLNNFNARQGSREQVYIDPTTILSSTESSIFYPQFRTTTSLMSSVPSSSVYTTGKSKRWEIEITDVSGSVDKMRWRSKATGFESRPDTEVFNDVGQGSWSDHIDIASTMTLTDHELDAIQVQFSALTGHDFKDRYVVNMRGSAPFKSVNSYNNSTFNDAFAWSCLVQKDEPDFGLSIGEGSEIKITIQESERTLHLFGSRSRWQTFPETVAGFADRDYVNLEEFFYENEEFFNAFVEVAGEGNLFHFRRGTKSFDGQDQEEKYANFHFSSNENDDLIMVIQSKGRDSGDLGENVHLQAGLSCVIKNSGDSKIVLETEAEKINSDVFYELPGTYEVNACGYHLGIGGDVTQTTDRPAVISLKTFNAYSWGNGIESSKIRDSFDSPSISINTKPLSTIQDYRENHRVSSITYSDVYEQSTNYNGLNEFNLSQINYKDVDDEYGDIRRIHSRDTDLVVFQENKVSKLLVNKSVLFNADGTGNIAQNVNVLGQQVPYVGEYGISYNAHSFASWGNRMYFVDDRRSAVMRLSQDGLTEISQFGMRDWFKDEIKPKDFKNIIGGYDPYTGQYVTSIKDPLVAWLPEEYLCPRCFCGMDGYIYSTSALPTTTTTTAATTTTTTRGSGEVGPNCVSVIFTWISGEEVAIQVDHCQPNGQLIKHTYKLNKENPVRSISCMDLQSGKTAEDFIVGGIGEISMQQVGECGTDTCNQRYNMYFLFGSLNGTEWLVWDCEKAIFREVFNVPAGKYVVVNTIYRPQAVNDGNGEMYTQADLMYLQTDPTRDYQDATNEILG